jgi:hypothetical protein
LGGNLFESDDFAYLYVRGRKEIGWWDVDCVDWLRVETRGGLLWRR